MDDEREVGRGVSRRKTALNLTFCVKKERDGQYRKVYAAIQKKEADRSEEERELLLNNVELVKKATESQKKREEVKARSEEFEDPDDVLLPKCMELAAALRSSHHVVVYTGAGISTAAKIPDYRGSNGIWTLLQKGKDIGKHDLSQAEPTLTHMALFELYSQGLLKYVVSQNCDGLHLRSGLPRTVLSEVHGNMNLEVCRECRPSVQYWRMFDVTENTGRFSHRTMRRCYFCQSALIDTIVHFGERGNLPWPLNWPAACKAADAADMILCIGSSLKVLKKYPWLWGMDKPARKRPKLYIINLQWTPKDDQAVLKINGRCDRVMQEVMKCLQLRIAPYDRLRDPIFCHATHLYPEEVHTTSQRELDSPFKQEDVSDRAFSGKLAVAKRTGRRNSTECPAKLRKLDNPGPTEARLESLIVDLQDETFISSVEENAVGCFDAANSIESLKLEACDMLGGENSFSVLGDAFLVGIEIKVESRSTDLKCKVAHPCNQFENGVSFSEEPGKLKLMDFGYDKSPELSRDLKIKQEDVLNSIDEKWDKCVCLGDASTESYLCAKCAPEDLNLGSSCIDGKENVAVLGVKANGMDVMRSIKKLDVEKPTDIISEPEKVISVDHAVKARTLQMNANMNGDGGKAFVCDTNRDSPTSKCSKPSGYSCEENVDDVGVLRMLQLEHNYSKSMTEERFEDKNLKNIEGEKTEEDKNEGCQQSVRTSSRVREKRTLQAHGDTEKKHTLVEKPSKSTANGDKPAKTNTNRKLTKADFEMKSELKSRTCAFCLQFYRSSLCMFYPSVDGQPRLLARCLCECCDYSSGSEEGEDECSGSEMADKCDGNDNVDEGTSKTVINPGWYGKGCRKKIRRRK